MKLKSIILALAFCLPILSYSQTKQIRNYHLIIGTYTKTQNNGLFVYKFDAISGKLSFESKTESITNPSFLVVNQKETNVYCVNEADGNQGSVSAFRFDAKNGVLSFINSQKTNSASPCHITLSRDNKFAFCANYGGGSISVFPIDTDGSLAAISQLITHKGSSIDKNRQNQPHVHSTNFSADGHILYVADLGTDFVKSYTYNANDKAPLQENQVGDIKIESGFGPRHFTFNKKGDKLYVLSEMKAYVSVFNYKNNRYNLIQKINTNALDFQGQDGGADIHLSNDGKFIYATNRGDANDIAIFKVQKNGKIIKIGNVGCKGKRPRNFAIDPSDNFLLVANQDTDDIYVFRRDKKTGLLKYNDEMLKLGNPVCLKFLGVR